MIAHVADVGLQLSVHGLHVLLQTLRVGKVLLAQIALLLGAPRRQDYLRGLGVIPEVRADDVVG